MLNLFLIVFSIVSISFDRYSTIQKVAKNNNGFDHGEQKQDQLIEFFSNKVKNIQVRNKVVVIQKFAIV